MDEIIQRLEESRKKLLPLYIVCIFCAVLAFVCFMINIVISIVLIIVAVAVFLINNRKHSRYVEEYKTLLVKAELEVYFDKLAFYPESGFSKEMIKSLNVISTGNIFRSEDYMSGEYNGVPFESAEVYIADKTNDSDGNSNTTVYFKGRWMIFDFNKAFRYDLQVREKGFSYAKRKGGLFSSDVPMNKVQMESETFNAAYTTYAADEHEAFYILTPPIMTSMMTLKERTTGKLMFCFIGNRLHVALHNNKNSFEPPIFKKLTVEYAENDIMSEIKLLTGFTDELQLDRKIWNKN